MPLLRPRAPHESFRSVLLTGVVALVLLFTVSAVSPGDVLGASTLSTRCDGVSLRTKPSTSSTRKAVLSSGVQVNAVTKVTGRSWRVTCAGKTATGNTWYRINNVNGRSASSRYGVSYVYAATALFKVSPAYPKYTACDGVSLRTGPSTSSTRKAVLAADVKVIAVARVTGGSWRSTCNGKTSLGTSWYRISSVQGRGVAGSYGVTYVYAATSLFTTTTSGTTPTPTPTQTPSTPGESVRVTSIAGLLTALDDNAMTDIVVADGTYRVSSAASQRADSLWIGARFADRTKAVTVRAETKGGVTFDGGGTTYFGGMTFLAGAHDQTWDGFRFANGEPTQTGVICFGGAGGSAYIGQAAPHHITLRNISIAGSVTSTYAGSGDHALYFSQAVGGPHDILVDGLTVDGSGGVNTAMTFYHSDASHQNAWNVTIRNLTVNGTHQAIEIWDSTIQNLVIEGARITNARDHAVRYEAGSGITLKDIVSTGTGSGGFYSSKGSNPPGVTFINDSFR